MINVWKTALILLSVNLTLAGMAIPAQSASQKKETSGETKDAQKDAQNETQENEIRKVLMDLATMASDGDAPKTASLWSEDAVFVDESGEETRGRTALHERFSKTVKQRGTATVELHPEKISFPAPNVALVIGSVSRKSGTTNLPATRFSMALQKQSGTWQIDQATETRLQELKSVEYLRELEWLIGNWQVDKPDNAAKIEFAWGAAHNFIVSKCTSMKNGVQQVDTQVIGWDPRSQEIVSWHFDFNGGFGYGKWSKQSTNGWLVDFAGVAPNGNGTTATNTFELKSPDEFTWQSSHQSSDGVEIADTEVLKIKKQKP